MICTEKHILVKKMFTNELNSIKDEDRPSMVSTPKMVYSVYVLILTD